MKRIFIFICLSINILANTLYSSNGNISLNYQSQFGVIKDIEFVIGQTSIDTLELGFFADNELFRIKDYGISLNTIDGSNIILLEADIDGKYLYKAYIYTSMLNRDDVVVEVEVEAKVEVDNIQLFYYINPSEDYMNINYVDNIYSYDNFYLNPLDTDAKLYLTNDIFIEELRLVPFTNNLPKTEDLALILLKDYREVDKTISDSLVISSNSISRGNEANIDNELDFWDEYLERVDGVSRRNSLATLKSYQRRDGSIYNFRNGNGLIYVDDMLAAIEAFMDYGYFEEARRAIRYLLNSSRGLIVEEAEKQGLISNYAYNLDREEVRLRDNYGYMFNLIGSAKFLELYIEFYRLTGDKIFMEQSFEVVNEELAEYLLTFVDQEGVVANSGDNRIGKQGMERFIESQKALYSAFASYIILLDELDLEIKSYKEARDNIKRSIILHYIDLDRVLDYPFATESKFENIYSLEEEFFFNEVDYFAFLKIQAERLDRYKDRTMVNQVDFINFLYDKELYRMGRNKRDSFVGRMDRSQINALAEMQKSIEFTGKYLIMLNKGDEDGDSL